MHFSETPTAKTIYKDFSILTIMHISVIHKQLQEGSGLDGLEPGPLSRLLQLEIHGDPGREGVAGPFHDILAVQEDSLWNPGAVQETKVSAPLRNATCQMSVQTKEL